MRQGEIVCLGEPLFELNQGRGEAVFRPGFGGDTSNVAVAAARQGAAVAVIGAVGNDLFGHALFDLWRSEGVDTADMHPDSGAPTGLYFVTHDDEGHHFFYRRAGSAASRYGPAQLPRERIGAAAILHASGISTAISTLACDAVFEAMAIARAGGALVSFDTNYRPALWPLTRARAIIEAAAAQSDILLPGLDDARQLTGLEDPDAICDHYLALGPQIVALTLGGKGALIATAERREHIAPVPVKVVDATGAGDTFDGAFLAEYLRTGDAFAAARYANAAAGLSTEGYGAIAPMPRRETVEAALRRLRDQP